MNYTSILLATLSILSATSSALKIKREKNLIYIPRGEGYSFESVTRALFAVTGDKFNFQALYFKDMTRGEVKALSRDLVEAFPQDVLKLLVVKLNTFDLPLKASTTSVVKNIIEAVTQRLNELDPSESYSLLRTSLPPGPSLDVLNEGEDFVESLNELGQQVLDVAQVLASGNGDFMEEVQDVKDQGQRVAVEFGEFTDSVDVAASVVGTAAKKRFHRNPLNYFREKPVKSVSRSEEESVVSESVVSGTEEIGTATASKKKRFNLSSLFGRRKEKGGFAPEWISNFRGNPQELLSTIVESFAALSSLAANDPSSIAAYRPLLLTIAQMISKAATAEGNLLQLDEAEMTEIMNLKDSLARMDESEDSPSEFVCGNFSGYQMDQTRNQYVPSSSKRLKSTKNKL